MRGRRIITFLAVGILTACSGHSFIRENPNANKHSEREDVFVLRARPTTPNLPVTSFCDDANFPATHPIERERSFEYLSVETRSKDGAVQNAALEVVGGHHGCYSRTLDGKNYTYGKGTLSGIPFTFRGSCSFTPEKALQPDSIPYTCEYEHTDLPGYIAGRSLWNGMTTTHDGFLTTSIGTIRLWKQSK